MKPKKWLKRGNPWEENPYINPLFNTTSIPLKIIPEMPGNTESPVGYYANPLK